MRQYRSETPGFEKNTCLIAVQIPSLAWPLFLAILYRYTIYESKSNLWDVLLNVNAKGGGSPESTSWCVSHHD